MNCELQEPPVVKPPEKRGSAVGIIGFVLSLVAPATEVLFLVAPPG